MPDKNKLTICFFLEMRRLQYVPLVSFIIIAASYGFHYHLVENSLEESLKLECSGEQFMVCEEMSNVGICDTWMLWNCYVS